MPRNLPRAMADGYYQWKAQNTGKIIGYERVPCDECGGEGFLWFKQSVPEYPQNVQATMVVRCSYCENSRRDVHPSVMIAMSRDQIVARGWTLLDERRTDAPNP